jgi:hypothetical protein
MSWEIVNSGTYGGLRYSMPQLLLRNPAHPSAVEPQ